jgi:hypothetical protein
VIHWDQYCKDRCQSAYRRRRCRRRYSDTYRPGWMPQNWPWSPRCWLELGRGPDYMGLFHASVVCAIGLAALMAPLRCPRPRPIRGKPTLNTGNLPDPGLAFNDKFPSSVHNLTSARSVLLKCMAQSNIISSALRIDLSSRSCSR